MVSLEEIRRDLPDYLSRTEAGDTLLVLRKGKVVAEIKPPAIGETDVRRPRPHGLCSGDFEVPDDFDEPLPEGILCGYQGD